MTGTAELMADAALVALSVRLAWSLGNTIVGHAAAGWDKKVLPMRCQRCGKRVFGTDRGRVHLEQFHSAELQAEQVIQAEANRQAWGTLFNRLRGDE